MIQIIQEIPKLEVTGMMFGLIAVYLQSKQNIRHWVFGGVYVIISLFIFWEAKLYADLSLHFFVYLPLTIYGLWYWSRGGVEKGGSTKGGVPVTTTPLSTLLVLIGICGISVALAGFYLNSKTNASVPYWDSTNAVLSLAAMWLTTRKRIENWILWIIVYILCIGIYFYKGIYFYSIWSVISLLVSIYGLLSWKKGLTWNYQWKE